MSGEPQEPTRLGITGWFVAMLIASAAVGGIVSLLGAITFVWVTLAG